MQKDHQNLPQELGTITDRCKQSKLQKARQQLPPRAEWNRQDESLETVVKRADNIRP